MHTSVIKSTLPKMVETHSEIYFFIKSLYLFQVENIRQLLQGMWLELANQTVYLKLLSRLLATGDHSPVCFFRCICKTAINMIKKSYSTYDIWKKIVPMLWMRFCMQSFCNFLPSYFIPQFAEMYFLSCPLPFHIFFAMPALLFSINNHYALQSSNFIYIRN